MNVLVVNSGSSSIKFLVARSHDLSPIVDGILEGIGTNSCWFRYDLLNAQDVLGQKENIHRLNSYREGFELILELLRSKGLANEPATLAAIGHRVVHGAERFREPILVTDSVLDAIRENIPLAPAHNPANLQGIELCREIFPGIPQVAVFDTAFHQSLPPNAYRYPLPEFLYAEHKIRRYGFHGTSHDFVSDRAAEVFGRPLASLNIITLHLGNGASVAAIQKGRCIDTSMGMTPLEGLMMGTRSGDIDPAIVVYLARTAGLDTDTIDNLLNKQSGLFGVYGSNDMRQIQQRALEGDFRAKLAIEMFCYRIKKYIGAYIAILGQIDALIFTAGIGENCAEVRLEVCQGMDHLGILIDPEKNKVPIDSATEIQRGTSPVKILVIPTDEETEIARQTLACINST